MCEYTADCDTDELDTRYARRTEYDEDEYVETTTAPKPIVISCEGCGVEYECESCGSRLFKRRDTRTQVRNNPSHEVTGVIGSRRIDCLDCERTLRTLS